MPCGHDKRLVCVEVMDALRKRTHSIPEHEVFRFAQKVVVAKSGCWEWIGSRMGNGYGQFYVAGKSVSSHRYSYEIIKGPVAGGFDLDHLCRNRPCVNPAHLEPVSRSVNIKRGDIRMNNGNAAKTSCPAGHPYNEENTCIRKPSHRAPFRTCRACARLRARKSTSTKIMEVCYGS